MRMTTRSTRPAAWLGALVAAATMLVAGCARSPNQQALAAIDFNAVGFAGDLVAPVVRGGNDGLEVVWFIAYDDRGEVGAALAPYVHQPLPIDAAAVQRWTNNGVRLVRVPLDDFSMIADTLESSGMRHRQWLGWALEWREAFKGRSVRRGSPVLVDLSRTATRGGPTRFLARCWTTPTLDGAVVRVELAAQLVTRLGATTTSVAEFESALRLGAPDMHDELDMGEVFASLSLDAAFEPGYAYVLTAESPGVSWINDEHASGALAFDDTSLALGEVFGPHVAGPLTIGEAMLTNRPQAGGERAAKVILAFIPRASERTTLLP